MAGPSDYASMTEVMPGLYVGDQTAYEAKVAGQDGWRVVHACKEPYHRELLGYTGRGAPKEHPEYFWAERGPRLYLNLVDAPDPAYIPQVIIDKALGWISESLRSGAQVLVHCNQGESRSPTIALLYLAQYAGLITASDPESAEAEFRGIYTRYNPGSGMRGYMRAHLGDVTPERSTES